MITDPCTCGIKPEGHAHVVNDDDSVVYWKGIPIYPEDNPTHKTYFMVNENELRWLPTRRKGKLSPVK